MEYMCAYKTCPHHADPCIFSEMDLEKGLSRSTICPVGEEERFITINRNKMFFCLIVGTRTYDDYETFSKIIDKVLSSKRDKKVVIVSGGAQVLMQWQNDTPKSEDIIWSYSRLNGKDLVKKQALPVMSRCISSSRSSRIAGS